MRWKEQLLKLKPYQPGKSISEVKRQYGLSEIVKLASNENPFGSSEKVKNEIAGYAGKFSVYPDAMPPNFVHIWQTILVLKKVRSFLATDQMKLSR
ncbi:biosynthetic aromatic amino acid aminotransferase beta [Mesobacillus boroniphilus JCM 21738]|uniref:Biosynthetic aromatic amino acid aminotransferase beta n=1 Tax=Mesobacillus boroniphilus JCM 21738 TaxID=1294265 RepID=W4RHV9_9BACI|nr:biosynthetic aromatic amino acid aminotransferase beta [Mesobacillus boroniphilus JCM 21738]